MSICLDPTHLVTCLLINFPQLFSLVTLIICSLYNLLVFAVPCGFVTLCLMSSVSSLVQPCPALSSLVQPCPALPCLLASQVVFPLRGSFCLFVLFLLNKLVAHNLHLSLRSLPFTPTLTERTHHLKTQQRWDSFIPSSRTTEEPDRSQWAASLPTRQSPLWAVCRRPLQCSPGARDWREHPHPPVFLQAWTTLSTGRSWVS